MRHPIRVIQFGLGAIGRAAARLVLQKEGIGSFTDAKMDKRGLFEEAQKGTLFLDEISELPLMLQAKLRRAIQEREIRREGATKSIPVDVRIIAATNLNLSEEVKNKRLREDFYYRLNVIELRLPPLRERREDIPILVDAFLKKCADSRGKEVKGLSESALAMLAGYAWPGNVRELENVIERAVTLSHGDMIGADDLPVQVQGSRGDRRILDEAAERTLPLHEVEKEYIVKILEKTGGNKYQAAHVLGSIGRPCIGSLPKSKANHTQTPRSTVSPSRWEPSACSPFIRNPRCSNTACHRC